MARKLWFWPILLLLGVVILSGSATPAFSQPMLKMVHIEADSPGAVKQLAGMGLDIAAIRRIGSQKGAKEAMGQTYRVEAVVSALDEIKLRKAGIQWSATAQAARLGGATATDVSETVYHSFDEPDLGIKDQLYAIAKAHPRITWLKTIGYSHQGRPLLAIRLSRYHHKCDKHGHGHYCDHAYGKPRVLFVATHHAREWVATQMAMRLIKYFTDNYRSDKRVSRLLQTT